MQAAGRSVARASFLEYKVKVAPFQGNVSGSGTLVLLCGRFKTPGAPYCGMEIGFSVPR